MFNRCYLAVLLLGSDGDAILEFIQNIEFVDLLVLPFREHLVLQQAHLTYRYNAVRTRLSIMKVKPCN
jgi:hypothetical protein